MSCPICHKPGDAKYRPFCSKRCADVDLAKWLSGSYAVPMEEEDAFSDPPSPADGPDDTIH